MKSVLKKIIPKSLFKAVQPTYHGLVAQIASMYFGQPSRKLFVIGVTGTAGKSTTVMMVAQILNSAGKKTGYITTAGSSDGNNSGLNSHALSMPGGWMLQSQLADMVKNGCEYAVVECTSEGLAQNRHLGIEFRIALFTNLSPAHLDSHGSFENYRAAKGLLFEALKNAKSETAIGVNLDDPNKNYFLDFSSTRKFGVSMRQDLAKPEGIRVFSASNIEVGKDISFTIENTKFELSLFGTFNVTNALLAIACCKTLGVNFETSAKALKSLNKVPGRMETFTAPNGATIIVDYAPEPAAMKASLEAVNAMQHEKIIHVFGSTGGHRDVAKRFEFGKISAELSDTIIITNDDVYDSDPNEIAQNIQQGINEVNNRKAKDVQVILDRTEAIKKALQIAQPKDIVLITGKGSEQFLVLPGNQRIAWDDRETVKHLMQNL